MNNQISNIENTDDTSFLIDGFKTKKSYKFKFIDISSPVADRYLLQDEYCKKYFRTIHEKRCGEIVIDFKEDKLAGYCFVFRKNEWDGYLSPLFIVDEYRGYGLSNILLKNAIEKYGAKKLIVDKKNEVAIRLYKKFGFKIMGNNGKYTSQYFMLLESEIDKEE